MCSNEVFSLFWIGFTVPMVIMGVVDKNSYLFWGGIIIFVATQWGILGMFYADLTRDYGEDVKKMGFKPIPGTQNAINLIPIETVDYR